MATSLPRLHPTLRLATIYVGVLLCAVLAAWTASVSLGFHIAPRTPSAAQIPDVAAPTSPRPSLARTSQSPVKDATPTSHAAASSTSTATPAPSSSDHAPATKFVPVTRSVEVITPSQNDNTSDGNSSTNTSDGNSPSTTSTVAGD